MLSDLIKPENVIIELESTDKDSLFAELAENLVRANATLDREEIFRALSAREEQMNTCIMKGIAVPHACCSCVEKPLVALGLSASGIDYEVEGTGTKNYSDSLVHMVFMLLFEQGNAEHHLHVLADCARLLHIPGFYKAIMSAKTSQEVCDVIRDFECEF